MQQIPVFDAASRFLRFVSSKQHAKEVAGKVLPLRPGFTREATRAFSPRCGLVGWRTFYKSIDAHG